MKRLDLRTLLAVGLLLAGSGAVTAAKDKPQACCFNNPGYSGTCKVTPAGHETCDSILEYLNNPSSTGKSYCGNTTVRGGWASVECSAH